MNRSDIASPELGAVEVHGMSRASFILRGAVAAGAVYGASAVGPYVSSALAQSGSSDVDILNFALTLEYLETDFYNVKGTSVGLSGEAKTLAQSFGDEEAEHVAALTKAITAAGASRSPSRSSCSRSPTRPASSSSPTCSRTPAWAPTTGPAPSLTNKEYLAAAGSIVQIEARHAAAIALLTGERSRRRARSTSRCRRVRYSPRLDR